jgi:hypothetical protein
VRRLFSECANRAGEHHIVGIVRRGAGFGGRHCRLGVVKELLVRFSPDDNLKTCMVILLGMRLDDLFTAI